jgi:hypothetical protein
MNLLASVFNLELTSVVVADAKSPNLVFNMFRSAGFNSSIAASYWVGVIELH